MLKWFRKLTGSAAPTEDEASAERPPLTEYTTPDEFTLETADTLEAGSIISALTPPPSPALREAAPPILERPPAEEFPAPRLAHVPAPAAPPFADLEPEPAPKKSLFARLRERLGKTSATLVDKVRTALRLHGKFDEALLEEMEMILIQSDVGVPTTQKIIDRLRREVPRQGDLEGDAVLKIFKQTIAEILSSNNRTMRTERPAPATPVIILVVGVNGAGKTTTIGKLAKQLSDQGKRVMMVAGDTFRAAAIEQLTMWAERTGSCIVRQDQGADPAAVVFEALEGAKADPPDVILIDTAGRLQTKVHLMEELRKVVRIIRKHYPEAPHETVLVLDATTGQNALSQVKLFHEACELTGLIMSKLDGTAKGGVLVGCKDQFPLPIFKIGIGEGVEDLRDFEPTDFVEALFSTPGAAGE